MKLLTAIKNISNKIDEIKNKLENEKLTNELYDAIIEKRKINLKCTLHILTNYLIFDQLERTGILYRPDDSYIQTKVQSLFWEWKNEGLINEFEDFEDTTKSWISVYI